jgi:LysR family hydrogen peroxide-inducible transcriptional activator
MELQQLRYFVSAVEVGSFTRAARACYVAQPSLSQQIRKLEEELGQRLFERLARSVRLTPAGQAFYERAAAILAAVAEARETVAESANFEKGEIRLGVIPTVAPYLVPGLLRAFARSFRQARVAVHEDFTEETVRGCLTGEIDLGIVALPANEARLTVEPLFSEELLLAVPAGHPLETKRQVTLDDLTHERFVLLSAVHCLGTQIVSFCERAGCVPAVSCKSSQLLTVQELVALGQGVSLIPKIAAQTDRSKRVHYRSLTGKKPSRTLAMIWHRHRYQSPLVRSFIETIRAEVKKGHVQKEKTAAAALA